MRLTRPARAGLHFGVDRDRHQFGSVLLTRPARAGLHFGVPPRYEGEYEGDLTRPARAGLHFGRLRRPRPKARPLPHPARTGRAPFRHPGLRRREAGRGLTRPARAGLHFGDEVGANIDGAAMTHPARTGRAPFRRLCDGFGRAAARAHPARTGRAPFRLRDLQDVPAELGDSPGPHGPGSISASSGPRSPQRAAPTHPARTGRAPFRPAGGDDTAALQAALTRPARAGLHFGTWAVNEEVIAPTLTRPARAGLHFGTRNHGMGGGIPMAHPARTGRAPFRRIAASSASPSSSTHPARTGRAPFRQPGNERGDRPMTPLTRPARAGLHFGIWPARFHDTLWSGSPGPHGPGSISAGGTTPRTTSPSDPHPARTGPAPFRRHAAQLVDSAPPLTRPARAGLHFGFDFSVSDAVGDAVSPGPHGPGSISATSRPACS